MRGSDLPLDVYRLGSVRTATASESAAAISEAESTNAAAAAGYAFPNQTAHLVVLRMEGQAFPPVSDRLVWLIRADGLEIVGPDPTGADASEPYHYAYVLTDARSGEFVVATYRV